LSNAQYSTLMVALCFAEVELGDGDFAAKIRTLRDDIIANLEIA